MFREIGKMFGLNAGHDLGDLMKNGAQVVDVRSKEEFASGHMKGSVNIPLHDLSKSLARINKNKPVIVCCASGMRSSSAKTFLRGLGYEVYNGGGWQRLQSKRK